MKRMMVPALALGLAMAFAAPARAGLLDCLHRDKCDPCRPKCEAPCKPRCEPCRPACPKPSDPCHGGHFSKLRGLFHGHKHGNGCKPACDPCGAPVGAPEAAPMEGGHSGHSTYDTTPAPRLTPVPNKTSMRTTTRSIGY
jgi:hypothetical protein